MAKGDPKRVQNSIDYNYDSADNYLKDVTQRTNDFYNPAVQNYNYSTGTNLNNYDEVMAGYRQFLGLQNPQQAGGMQQGMQGNQQQGQNWNQQSFAQQFGSPGTPQELIALEPKLNEAGIKVLRNAEGTAGKIELPNGNIVDLINSAGAGGRGFQWLDDGGIRGSGSSGPGQNFDFGALTGGLGGLNEFSQTGGYSPQDISNIRARAVAPIRSTYSNMQDELERSKSLAGPQGLTNYNALAAKLAREKSYNMADASTNAEAAIAQMVNQGKQFGISGLTSAGMGLRGQGLTGFSGMGNLYGTTPGLTSMFGDQVLKSSAQGIDIGQLRNQLASDRVNAQLGKSKMPTRVDTAGQYIDMASDVAKMAAPFL